MIFVNVKFTSQLANGTSVLSRRKRRHLSRGNVTHPKSYPEAADPANPVRAT
jgi:hypothetical protein